VRRLSPPRGSLAASAQEGITARAKSRGRGNSATRFHMPGLPLLKLEIGFLQQAFPCMALENLCVPDVTPQCVHALVPRLIGHLEDRGAARGSAGQEARAQPVSGKLLRIEPGASGVCLFTMSATLRSVSLVACMRPLLSSTSRPCRNCAFPHRAGRRSPRERGRIQTSEFNPRA
jgi:hypothetical protein